MISQLQIIDDFYPDPDAIWDLVQSMPREDASGGNYAGVMTTQSFFTPQHQEALQSITGQALAPATKLNGCFRFTTQEQQGRQHIHFDPGENNVWAGVCFLQKPGCYPTQNSHGTDFWRHKRTGLSSIPLTQEGIEKHGWQSVDDLQTFLETDGVDESRWDLTLTVPYAYNRLVLFRPWMFHSPGAPFGDTVKDCRIIQTFFLRPA